MSEVKIECFEKMEPIKYVRINGEDFRKSEMCSVINQILMNTKEDDHYGDYSLHDYEIDASSEVIDCLVKLGYVRNYTGSRMANLYCIAKGKTEELEELLNTIYKNSQK